MNNLFEISTEEQLNNTINRYYVGGRELKIGDKIIFGYGLNYANLNGKRTPLISQRDESYSLLSFVVMSDGMICELYNLRQK